jgi:hypothetical protein
MPLLKHLQHEFCGRQKISVLYAPLELPSRVDVAVPHIISFYFVYNFICAYSFVIIIFIIIYPIPFQILLISTFITQIYHLLM